MTPQQAPRLPEEAEGVKYEFHDKFLVLRIDDENRRGG